jgi:hypothetical protein
MKKLLCLLLLLTLLALPVTGFTEEAEPFLFRGRYAWGISADEIRQLAAEEGLAFGSEFPSQDPFFISYTSVPVAGIIAEELTFFMIEEKDRLNWVEYCITSDPQKALAWYPKLLEQLTLLYGDYDEEASQQLMDEHEWSHVFVWKLPTVTITLIGQTQRKVCMLSYLREDPPPAPTPTPMPMPMPAPVVFTGDGL